MAWRYKIDLANVLIECAEKHDMSRVEEDCPEEVKEMIIQEISKASPLKRFAKPIQDCKSIAALNRVLEQIYDESDFSRVWCGI
jgi:hypothetical protein